MKVTVLFLVSLFAVSLWGCATRAPSPVTQPSQSVLQVSPEARAEFERKQQEKAKQEEETFEVFSDLLDEYQNLVALCERVPNSDEARWIKESCSDRLKKLRQKLIELGAIPPENR